MFGIRGLLYKLTEKYFAKIRFQKKWEALYDIVIRGMCLREGDKIHSSGEEFIVKHILSEMLERKNSIVFDVGANAGEYSNMILENIKNTELIVHSFEPAKKTYDVLKKNIQDERAVIHNFGLSDSNCKQILFSEKECSRLASLYKRNLDHYNIDFNNEEEVRLSKLDDFCFEERIAHISFLKIDVEGNELRVLKGAEKMLNDGRIGAIQFEFGGTDIDSRTFFRDFWELLHEKYRIYRILPDGLSEIEEYSQKWEIFQCVNYLALKRKETK